MTANKNSAPPAGPRSPFHLADWLIEPNTSRVSRGGSETKLEPKVMDLLVYMAERPGQVLSREELEQAIWTGTVVGYDALTGAIIKLRKALEDSSRKPKIIETVAKRGYRLIGTVKSPEAEPATTKAPLHPATHLFLSKPQQLLALSIAFVVAMTLIVYQFGLRGKTNGGSATTFSKPTIVVLPFVNSNKSIHYEYFSDGITDDLINDLSRFSGINVIARRTAYFYKDRPSDIQTIAKELGVRYVLDGDVRRDGNKLRLNAQLIDASSGLNIWAQRFDRDTREIFQVQDDIRKNIINALSLTLTQEERKHEQIHYTSSYEAYDLFLRGQAIMVARSSAAENMQAIALMQQAIELDPHFARAHAALAYAMVEGYRFGWLKDLEKTRRKALTMGQKAIEIDPQLVQGYWILGNVYLFLYEDHANAIKMAERAVELAPNNSDALLTLAVSYSHGGNPGRAKSIATELMQRSSVYSSLVPAVLGQANLLLGNYAEALAAYEKSLDINPTYLYSSVSKVLVHYRMGQKDEAQFQIDELYRMHPDFKLEEYAVRVPYSDKKIMKGMIEDLIRAGIKAPQ